MSIRGLQALFVFGLLAALLTWVLERSGTTFSPVDRRDIWTLHVAMTGMLLGLAMLIRPSAWRAAGFAAVFGVGAWTISVVPAAGQYPEWEWAPWAAAALRTYAVHVGCRAIEAHRRARWMLCPSGAVAAAVILAGSWIPRAGGEAATAAPDLEVILGPELRPLTFTRTPNLYVLSFEAFTDARVLHEHFGSPREGTALHATLKARARPVGALYANGSYTMTAFNLIASLGPEAYERLLDTSPRGRLVLFAGDRRSPLFELVRANGYRVVTGYRSAHFATHAGPGVDEHVAVWERSACGLMRFRHPERAFWGYCGAGDGRLWFGPSNEDIPHERLMEVVEAVEPGTRQLTWLHFALPDHVHEGVYDHRDESKRQEFREWHVERSARAAQWLERMLRHVEAEDPEAIVLIFGDHGVRASYNPVPQDDRRFVLRDRFSVAGGIFPPEACRREIDAAEAAGWLTHLDLIHALLRCLAGGKDARYGEVRYRPRLYEPDAEYTWGKYARMDGVARYDEFVRPWSDRTGGRGR